jgi:hypothetical protein
MPKYRLSEEQKQRINMNESAKALPQYPGSFVKVFVWDETDDNGVPRVKIILAGQNEVLLPWM